MDAPEYSGSWSGFEPEIPDDPQLHQPTDRGKRLRRRFGLCTTVHINMFLTGMCMMVTALQTDREGNIIEEPESFDMDIHNQLEALEVVARLFRRDRNDLLSLVPHEQLQADVCEGVIAAPPRERALEDWGWGLLEQISQLARILDAADMRSMLTTPRGMALWMYEPIYWAVQGGWFLLKEARLTEEVVADQGLGRAVTTAFYEFIYTAFSLLPPNVRRRVFLMAELQED